MDLTTVIYIIIALLFSCALSWLLYFFRQKERQSHLFLLFGLRGLAIFLLLLLFINPTIERKEVSYKKPLLSVLVDNSRSIKFLEKETSVMKIITDFNSNPALNDKFEVAMYQFGEELTVLDTLQFFENQTNIYEAIRGVDALDKGQIGAMVLLSDGNQTKGSLYPYVATTKNSYPVVIGDTLPQIDLQISQVNVNAYSYLGNTFPIEITALYEGDKSVSSQVVIEHKGKVIAKRKVSFTADKTVQLIRTVIPAQEEGIHYYKASIGSVKNEQNRKNNSKTVSVEVLNEQTKVLLLTSVMHPDIGALKKAIETNKQRSVSIHNVEEFTGNLSDFQLVLLYQPTFEFASICKQIAKNKSSYFVITGRHTDWNFLNQVQANYTKKYTNQKEEVGAIFNNGFLTFGQKNINFESFSPLEGVFGELVIQRKMDALLYQNISGIDTEMPLLATFENGNQKSAALFGEGIWKWRATSFVNNNSFQEFDALLGNMVQYLASNTKRARLTLDYKKVYPANTSVVIAAYFVDKNYQFDPRAVLNLKLKNLDTDVTQNVPFSLKNESFEAVLENVAPGNYQFFVRVKGQKAKGMGQFRITDYQIEEQFSRADHKNLRLLAKNTKGLVYHETSYKALINDLIADTRYATIQDIRTVQKYLIEWKLLLFLTILIFTLEWFIRKYLGKT